MLLSYLSLVGQAFSAPRRAAQRILTPQPGLFDGILLAIAASCITMAAMSVTELALARTVVDVINEMLAYVRTLLEAEVKAGKIKAADMPVFPKLGAPPALWFQAVVNIALGAAFVSLGGGLAWLIASKTGGKATLAATRAIFGAWLLAVYTPLTILLHALLLNASPQMIINGFVFAFAPMLYGLYILAAFIAEANKFKSARGSFFLLIIASIVLYMIYVRLISF
ncbi:MAG: hypothetical protein MRY74_12575 [Neomegalonema sp.]|nr:hypothetical protein [Neomegalonema sp.]